VELAGGHVEALFGPVEIFQVQGAGLTDAQPGAVEQPQQGAAGVGPQ
jgi:hypothetical protein